MIFKPPLQSFPTPSGFWVTQGRAARLKRGSQTSKKKGMEIFGMEAARGDRERSAGNRR
jgi:hypothetical protein